MRQTILYILLISALLLAACGKDEYVYPPVLTEFISAGTDESGCISTLQTDKGVSYRLENRDKYTGLTADSVYRVIAVYEVKDTVSLSAYIYSLGNVFAPEPVTEWSEEIIQDPVDVQSIWLSGDYLNMILLVKAQNEKHTFRFIRMEDSPSFHLTLYHDKGEDVEAYTQRAYLSVPLQKYKTYCKEIYFTINTFEYGNRTYRFDM